MIGMAKLVGMAVGGGALLLALAGAQRPAVLAQTQGGLWEVSGIARPPAPQRLCVADTVQLAQYEHRSGSCTRMIIRDTPSLAEIHYTCAGGGFGRSKVTLITPRSLRIETQGISANAPFYYLLHARRVGNCRTH